MDEANAHPLPAHLTVVAHEPWERDPRETDREWQLFSLFRMSAYPAGDPVSSEYTPRHLLLFAGHVGLSKERIYQLASRNGWSQRCAAYDRIVDRQRTHQSLTELERMHEDHKRENAEWRAVLRDGVARLQDDLRGGQTSMKPSELLMLTKLLHDNERLLYGEATARTESRSLNVSVSLQGAPAEVREWYRAQALAAQNRT